jgi:Leucine-rich repeat (LRR) protein
MNELEEIPSSIGQLKQLHEFNLSRNKLKTLPAEVGLMEELFALDVSFNKDFSKVPHELYPLYTLTNAKFLYCNLAELPNTRSDSDLVGMKWMCLEGNKITELPLKVQGLTDIPPNYEASQTTYAIV